MTDRREAARRRSEEYRERRRKGVVLAAVELQPETVRALEGIGLLPRGERDSQAVADAAARYLHAAPAVASLGAMLFPAGPDDAG